MLAQMRAPEQITRSAQPFAKYRRRGLVFDLNLLLLFAGHNNRQIAAAHFERRLRLRIAFAVVGNVPQNTLHAAKPTQLARRQIFHR